MLGCLPGPGVGAGRTAALTRLRANRRGFPLFRAERRHAADLAPACTASRFASVSSNDSDDEPRVSPEPAAEVAVSFVAVAARRFLRRHDGRLVPRPGTGSRKNALNLNKRRTPKDRLFCCGNETISMRSRQRQPVNMKLARCEFTDGIHKQKARHKRHNRHKTTATTTKQGPCFNQYEARVVSIRGIAPVRPNRRVPHHRCRS
jgi:hypothetical protein